VWTIDRELLLKRFPLKEREEAAPAGGGPPAGELVAQVLQEQLRSKDEQIRTLEKQLDRKDEQIANLGERQRETNVLMRELQARLALAAPRAPASTVEEADAAEPPLAHRGQPTAPATTPPVRRNRLLRLLGL
jgi:TolA-binding protein